MPSASNEKERHFWQVAVRHMNHLREIGRSPGAGFFAERYAELVEKDESFQEEWREDWDGTEYEDFKEVEGRRRSFHEKERSLHLRRLWQKALALATGDPGPELALSNVNDPIVRKLLCKAIHDTSDSQVQELLEMKDGSDEGLKVYSLSSGEIDDLGQRALEAARHGIALEVLDEVSHYLGGYETYEADPKTVLGSPAEIAKAVQAEHAEKPRAERVDIAMRDYRLHPYYDGNTDERHVRKALNQAFAREGQ